MKKLLYLILFSPLFCFGQDFPTIELGTTIPSIEEELLSIDGNSYSLKNIKGPKGTLVIFTSNSCPFVVMWENRYKQLEKSCTKNNLGMVYINSNDGKRDSDDSYEKMQKHGKEMGYNFPYLLDKNSLLANKFGAKTTPHVFLFDAKNHLKYKGAIDDNYRDIEKVEEKYLLNAIESMIKGDKISPNETPPVGCSVKRSKK